MELALLIIVLIALLILIYLNLNKKPSNEIVEWLKSTSVRMENQNNSFNSRIDNTAKIISDLQKNIADFSNFLSSPKLRGNMGEQVLKELLKQFLPNHSFELQYTFKSGEKVDAIIKTSGGIIPVDSKFPMENFRKMHEDEDPTSPRLRGARTDFVRDVRKHIDDISKKYILVLEGTVDYALMYIPSEAVYYEIVNNSDLFDYSSEKRILFVSPSTFYAYMKAILMSFEGQKIEAQAKQILSSLRAIQNDYQKVETNLSVMQKHLTNSYNMMTNVFSSFNQLGQKISNTQKLGDGGKGEKEVE
ncbi:MAG TPA: DNA recombination protein RmuC [Alphaproteobacteria bacterium]|nr:DNA recombination protein RmuC [Alphaproteobacteria bacterium]